MEFANRIGAKLRAEVATRPNINPSDTYDVLGEFAQGSASDVSDAVSAARAAFPAWSRTTRVSQDEG